jgi:UDP:flavonoid glycosyltransferase YjiC (YdhE family)
MKFGVHIPVKKLDADKLISALSKIQTNEVRNNAAAIGGQIRNEKGLENAVNEIEKYFNEAATGN